MARRVGYVVLGTFCELHSWRKLTRSEARRRGSGTGRVYIIPETKDLQLPAGLDGQFGAGLIY